MQLCFPGYSALESARFQPKLMITLLVMVLIAFIIRNTWKVIILPITLSVEVFEDSFLLSYEEKMGIAGPCISASKSEIKSIVYDKKFRSIIFHGNLQYVLREHSSKESVITLMCKEHEIDLIISEFKRMWNIEDGSSLIHEGDFSTLEGKQAL